MLRSRKCTRINQPIERSYAQSPSDAYLSPQKRGKELDSDLAQGNTNTNLHHNYKIDIKITRYLHRIPSPHRLIPKNTKISDTYAKPHHVLPQHSHQIQFDVAQRESSFPSLTETPSTNPSNHSDPETPPKYHPDAASR